LDICCNVPGDRPVGDNTCSDPEASILTPKGPPGIQRTPKGTTTVLAPTDTNDLMVGIVPTTTVVNTTTVGHEFTAGVDPIWHWAVGHQRHLRILVCCIVAGPDLLKVADPRNLKRVCSKVAVVACLAIAWAWRGRPRLLKMVRTLTLRKIRAAPIFTTSWCTRLGKVLHVIVGYARQPTLTTITRMCTGCNNPPRELLLEGATAGDADAAVKRRQGAECPTTPTLALVVDPSDHCGTILPVGKRVKGVWSLLTPCCLAMTRVILLCLQKHCLVLLGCYVFPKQLMVCHA